MIFEVWALSIIFVGLTALFFLGLIFVFRLSLKILDEIVTLLLGGRMPIPKPRPGENDDNFIARCMQDEVMLDEYPNASTRAAVCYNSLRDSREKSTGDRDVRKDTKRG
jgi:hypothetical protein